MTNQSKIWSLSGAVLLAISLVSLWVWPKFVGVDTHPIFGWAELQTGIAWLEPYGRWMFGVIAAALAVLVILRRTRVAGSIGALVLSGAFIIAHMTPWLGWNVPDYAPLIAAIEAGQSAAYVESLGLKGDRGAHFSLAIINAMLAAVTLGASMTRSSPKTAHRYVPMQLSA